MHSSSNESDSSESIASASNEIQFVAERVATSSVILEISQIKRKQDEAIRMLTKKYEATVVKIKITI